MLSQFVQLICAICNATGFEKKGSNYYGTPLFFSVRVSPQNGESVQRPNTEDNYTDNKMMDGQENNTNNEIQGSFKKKGSVDSPLGHPVSQLKRWYPYYMIRH